MDAAALRKYVTDRCIMGDGCWEWQLSKGNHGYPQGCLPKETGQAVSLAHRMSYMGFKGEIESGMQIDHLCKNKNCVNPDHLEQVTQQLNIRRQFSGMEDTALCARGHDPSWFLNSKGRRECRECRRHSQAKYMRSKKGV